MVRVRKESGMTVDAWCRENGISKKTYYYRLKRLRLEALKEQDVAKQLLSTQALPGPVFTELDFSKNPEVSLPTTSTERPAVTVRIGTAMIVIHNGAEAEVITNTLRVMKEIC